MKFTYTLVSDKSTRKDKAVGEPIVWDGFNPNRDEVMMVTLSDAQWVTGEKYEIVPLTNV